MPEAEKHPSNKKIILFVITVCFICALILSILASALKKPQFEARELYKSKQLLIAARILNYNDVFLIEDDQGNFIPAIYDARKEVLVPSKKTSKAKNQEILTIFQNRVETRVVNSQGELFTFEKAGLDKTKYIKDNERLGYARLPYKLLYIIQPNLPPNELEKETKQLPYAYVIPINGYGLWGPIYGYIAVKNNADTVLGTTWYDQVETPGLGGNISLPEWQQQFYDKVIFQETDEGTVNFERAPLGITVVKTKVSDEYGTSPKSKSAVDGIPGASITVQGVSEAYRNSLNPYRNFLIKAHERAKKEGTLP